MCDGWNTSSLSLIVVGAQPSAKERDARATAQRGIDSRKLLRPEELIPEVAKERCSRMTWNGDVMFRVGEIVTQVPNADPYETKRRAATAEETHAILAWAISRGLTVQVTDAMTCHPGGGFNEHFTTVPLDLDPMQLVMLMRSDMDQILPLLGELVAGRPKLRHDAAGAAA